ncbi:hypothetical protein Gotri_014086 [Gossypium trilobum]|uniref:Uncharacterized protein n=1 Tax=Gossypium trilobum TaxID=34281 RepID=A0A7J9DW18_9ROSI|nr:hypothetical protein [Gossypium trilobum]
MSQLKHLEEVLLTGDPIRTWWNEQRIWMMKAIISYTIGMLNAVLKLLGLKEANFVPTNKVADDEQITFYQKGLFNFQASTVVLTPLITLVTLNMICFAAGATRTVVDGSFNAMFGQIFLSFYVLMVQYPFIDGMIFRRDKGRVPTSVTLLSLAISASFLCFGSLIIKSLNSQAEQFSNIYRVGVRLVWVLGWKSGIIKWVVERGFKVIRGVRETPTYRCKVGLRAYEMFDHGSVGCRYSRKCAYIRNVLKRAIIGQKEYVEKLFKVLVALPPSLIFRVLYSQNSRIVCATEQYEKPVPKFKFSHKWLEGKRVLNEHEGVSGSDPEKADKEEAPF